MDSDGCWVRPIPRTLVKGSSKSGFPGRYLCSNMEKACMLIKLTKRKASQRDKEENHTSFIPLYMHV